MPEPTRTPKRVPSTRPTSSPASSTAITAQARAYLRYRSSLRSSFFSTYLSGSKPRTSATTRVVFTDRPRRDAPLSRLLFDVADGVSDRGDLLRVLIRDLEAELLLERHHQLHRVEGVGVQIRSEERR